MENQNTKNKKKETIFKILRRVLGIIIIIIGLILSVVMSLNAMNMMAALTKSGFWGYLALTVSAIAMTFGFTYLGMKVCSSKKKTRIITGSITSSMLYALVLGFILIVLYAPVKNSSSYSNITYSYWQLDTGSKIAYKCI